MRSLPRCTTVGCSEKSILLFSPYFTTLSVVVRVCIRKPVNKGFSADFAKWNISDASVGTEELAHWEMIGTMIHQCMQGATCEELKAAGLDGYYVVHSHGVFPVDPSGVPFTASYIQCTGDPIADISEDMAAEQKARATYEHLMNMTANEQVIEPLFFLREREIVHYQRFGECLDILQNLSAPACACRCRNRRCR